MAPFVRISSTDSKNSGAAGRWLTSSSQGIACKGLSLQWPSQSSGLSSGAFRNGDVALVQQLLVAAGRSRIRLETGQHCSGNSLRYQFLRCPYPARRFSEEVDPAKAIPLGSSRPLRPWLYAVGIASFWGSGS